MALVRYGVEYLGCVRYGTCRDIGCVRYGTCRYGVEYLGCMALVDMVLSI